MNHRADAHTNEDIGKHLFEGAHDLLFCVYQSVFHRQIRRFDVHTALGSADEFLNIVFHMQLFDDCTACNGYDQTDDYINDGDFCSENAHKQDKASQIHHGRGNQKGEGHAQRQSGAGKADEQRDRGTGAEGRHRAQQCGDNICPYPPESAQYSLTPLRREEALDVGDHENQEEEQYRNFDHVVEKKLDASAPAGCRVQSQGR